MLQILDSLTKDVKKMIAPLIAPLMPDQSSVERCHTFPSQRKRDGYGKMVSGYFVFLLAAVVVARLFSDGDFSGIYTFGQGVQCLAFYMLYAKVNMQRSVAGLSAKTLEVYVLVFVCRLSSTMLRNGYLPMDYSGDFIFQISDILSLGMTIALLRCVRNSLKHTYQIEHDTLEIARLVPLCVILAIFVHGQLNRSPFFDTMWTISMNLDTVAMLPQLWMLSKIGGEVEGMTSHFVALLALSRFCAFSFWFYGYVELQRGGTVMAGYQLLGAHTLQVLLSLDFLYYYLSARMKGNEMKLPSMEI
jgi:hypothetical protein